MRMCPWESRNITTFWQPLTLLQIVEVGAIDWIAEDEDSLDFWHGTCDPLASAVHVKIAWSALADENLLVALGLFLMLHVDVSETIVLDVRDRLS